MAIGVRDGANRVIDIDVVDGIGDHRLATGTFEPTVTQPTVRFVLDKYTHPSPAQCRRHDCPHGVAHWLVNAPTVHSAGQDDYKVMCSFSHFRSP